MKSRNKLERGGGGGRGRETDRQTEEVRERWGVRVIS